MTAPYTAAELAAILAEPPSWVCTKCGYCGVEGPEHTRGDGEPCRYTPLDVNAKYRRLVAELTRAREAIEAARSQLRSLPASKTAWEMDQTLRAALGDAFAEATASKEEPADLSRRSSEGA